MRDGPADPFRRLHPATGLIGGLVCLPTGWILADLFWVGLGLLAASFLPGGALLKTAVMIAVYRLSAVPVALIKTSAARPMIDVRSVEAGPHRLWRDEPITIVTRLQPREFTVGRNLPGKIGGDIACSSPRSRATCRQASWARPSDGPRLRNHSGVVT